MDAYEVDEDEAQTDGQTSEVIGSTIGLGGSTEDYEHEDAGEHGFYDQAVGGAEGAGIGTSSSGDDDAWVGGNDAGEDSSCDDGADDLEQHVHGAVLSRDASVEEYAECDGGVDVAARDASDGVGHGDDGQTECYSGSYIGSSVLSATQRHGSAATQECQHEGADEFSKILFHSV